MKKSKTIKTTVLLISLIAMSTLFMSFMAFPIDSNTDINSSWKAKTTETLYNSEYKMTLTLYSNGYVTLKSGYGPTSGNYDIESNKKITINWDDYDPEYGYVTTVSTTSGLRIKSAVVHGVTFDNTERFVLPR